MDDLDGARRRSVGVVAQEDGLADEHGIDLVESAVEADGAVLHHAAFGLEEEQLVEVEAVVGVAHVVGAERPLVEGGAPVESAVGRLVVLGLDPGPQGAVQCVEAGGGFGGEVAQPGGAKGAEESLDFSLSGGLIGPGVDEGDAEWYERRACARDQAAGLRAKACLPTMPDAADRRTTRRSRPRCEKTACHRRRALVAPFPAAPRLRAVPAAWRSDSAAGT